MTPATRARRRRWLAPEVVQTSTMDCGPAALKCLLEGHHIPVSYGRLREACQTSVDGTSIDTIETVARQLGLDAEQAMIPGDHLTLEAAQALPSLVVVRHADTAPHFVIVWRRWRGWLQVMDPALGRRWVRLAAFRDELYRHEMSVPAAQWRAWAGSDEFVACLMSRLAALGLDRTASRAAVDEALAEPGWFPIGTLDATVRLVQSLLDAGGVAAGEEAQKLMLALFRGTCARGDDIYARVAESYWSAIGDTSNTDASTERLRVRGAALIRVRAAHASPASAEERQALAPELAAALSERPATPLSTVWGMLREDGLLAPLALAAAMGVAAVALMLEVLLFRGLFDIAGLLAVPLQRLWAAAALLAFVLIVLLLELPIALETLRHGRRLETRLRMALLRKLPRLNDRYFQSRPITDMADRSHNIYAIRNVPGMGLHFIQSLFELGLTLLGVSLIAPDSVGMALLLVGAALAIPLAVQPLLNERDLRVRNHAGALHGFYLDALLGLAPVRAHRAERNVRRQHESLLVEWAQSLGGWMRMAVVNSGVQASISAMLAGGLIVLHFRHAGHVSGSDLLLIYWTLKLPAIGASLAGLAHQYPAQRNVLLRLLEPLSAPEDFETAAAAPEVPANPSAGRGVAVRIEGGRILAGGHEILRGLELAISPGEHVAVVGVSGAGKSSLLGLLLGWHRLADGRLLIDGQSAGGAQIEALRRMTAWVDPAIQIWNKSLLENLEYAADDEPMERVGQVMAAARLRGIAEKLPRGLQTLLGEGGGALSGGEGQRVRLGRALFASGTRLALLDEPFRGLDRDQRRTLLAEARAWWNDITLICVTHDVGETRAFDRVLVVEDGRIVEDGAPRALASNPTRYRELLAAEERVQTALWRGPQWRRLSMTDGRIVEQAQA